ncbi:MAG: hypothetical protein JST19_06510 [Bacteroidetes bacterium]|nr:hypothetical protein [Bacteroidota bacterium]
MGLKRRSLFYSVALLILFSCKKEKTAPANINVSTSSQLEVYGLGTTETADRSLDKSYDFYFDQFDGTVYQSINCGPAVATMAVKWADPSFNKKPADARIAISEKGGWWLTSDIGSYLDRNGISHTTVSFNTVNANQVIEHSIDNGQVIILCLDMYYAQYNPINTEHTNKFYATKAKGWGHFLLVKGYVKVDSKTYYDIYDPYSDHETYADNTLKGKDRYYLDTDITAATDRWWQYAILVAPKGKKVIASAGLQINSIQQNIPAAKGR